MKAVGDAPGHAEVVDRARPRPSDQPAGEACRTSRDVDIMSTAEWRAKFKTAVDENR